MKTYIIGLCIGTLLVGAGLCVMPGSAAGFVISAYLSITLVLVVAGRKCLWMSPAVVGVIFGAVTVSTLGVIANTYFFTKGGSLPAPLLENLDMNIDWHQAMDRMHGVDNPDRVAGRAYSDFIAVVCTLFGCNIAVPMMFNVLFYGLALLTMGQIAWLATDDRKAARVTVIAAACMCYLLAQSMTLIKDAGCTLLMALAAMLMLRWSRRENAPGLWITLAMIAVIVASAVMRHVAGIYIAIGAGIFMLSDSNKKHGGAYLLAIIVGVAVSIMLQDHRTNVTHVIQSPEEASFIDNSNNTRAFDVMMDTTEGSEKLTMARRLLWLPVSVVVQFLVPFPWNFLYHTNYGPSMALAHVAYPWYLAGALILYWIFGCMRTAPRRMKAIVIWGVILTIATAFATTGRVSRYCLPLLPLLLPAAAVVATQCLRRRSLWIWLAVFTALLIPTLIICHHLQGQYM